SDTLYIEALAAQDTIATIPEKTLSAFAERGRVVGVLEADGGDAEAVLARFAAAGIDVDRLAIKLQHDGAGAFVKSWRELLQLVDSRGRAKADAARRTRRARN
ncbi:MAG: transaldolase family protein, partial [Gemmatimonadaceae bacterium]